MIRELKSIYNFYPRRFFTSWSFTVKTFDEFMSALYKNVSHSRCSSSIYNYDGVEKDVIVDRIVFDLDSADSYSEMKRLHTWLLDSDIKHFVVFSGENFHVYAKVEGDPVFKKDALKTLSREICSRLQINNDKSVPGNIAHNMSIPGTFNFKRNRYVRSLSQRELELSHGDIRELAKKQGETIYFFGSRTFDISRFDYPSKIEVEPFDTENLVFLDDKLLNDLPNEAKIMLQDSELGHNDRLKLISYLCDFGLGKNQIIEILKKHLSPKKFYHCVSHEKQVEWALRKKYQILQEV